IVTEATVRVFRRPESFEVEAGLFPDWPSGVEATRRVLQRGIPLDLLRLSDEPETEVALTVGLGSGFLSKVVRTGLRLKGIRGSGCLLLVGAKGEAGDVERALDRTRATARSLGAVWLGRGPGRKWQKDRYRHPYLRDGLLDRGLATETLETAAPWSKLDELYDKVRTALREGVGPGEKEVPVLCHLSHPYPDGASLYFTFFYRCPPDCDEAVARWADLKRRASRAIAEAGGAASHHHGVGRFHAPWLRSEVGDLGAESLAAVASRLDPRALLNPGVLLDPADRLEE
ncbi:MAG: FAD-binding oxidoreductase, partial [Acidobacteria bacterium]|nr:FAD-binding oxidoreductase [Acidobacteriota bacterium]